MNEFEHCPTEGAIGLVALLINSGRLAEARLDGALADVGLSFVKWRALDALAKAPEPIPLKLLAERLHCVKSNVTQLVDKLEEERLVRRMPDAEDRRSILVELTDGGAGTHRAGREALEGATRRLFASVGAEEQALLRKLLTQVGSA